MNKYINIIIISFFSLLLSKYDLALTFYIPILMYYGSKNVRNIILIFVVTTLALYFGLTKEMYPVLIVAFAFAIYIVLLKKASKMSLNLVFALILNIITYGISNGFNDLFLLAFFSIVSTFFLAFLYYNQENALNITNVIGGFSFNELLMAIIATTGATTLTVYDINVGLLVAIYFAIYFTSSKHYYKAIFYIIVATGGLKFVFGINESYLLIIIASIYSFPKILSTFILFAFILFLYLIKIDLLSETLMLATMGVGLFFEIFRFTLISDDNNQELISNIHENVIKNVNMDTVSFASFLDGINKDLAYTKEYNYKIKEAITSIYKTHCEQCNIRKDCFNKNKGKLYFFYKNMLNNTVEEQSFCPNYYEIKRTAFTISNKYNILNSNMKNEVLSLLTNGLSTILRQYSIEGALKDELDYTILFQIKKDIIDYGLTLTLFDVKSALIDNFLIEIGVSGVDFKDIEHAIEKIGNNYIPNKVSLVFKHYSRNRVYFNMVPKVNFEVTYGYGALAPLGNNICGDNYLVKQLNNSRIMAAISDGMGKGINANIQSATTLRMLDEITNMNIMADTALQILNTLIYIQDYQEIYSTLDFVEINRQKGEALFYKAGGTTTYIFHCDGNFERIENENLPFGIEEIIETKKVKLKNDDLIIMASDGVFENVVNTISLEAYINSIRNLEPQKLIYELLNYTRYSDLITKDDMSIIALKIIAC